MSTGASFSQRVDRCCEIGSGVMHYQETLALAEASSRAIRSGVNVKHGMSFSMQSNQRKLNTTLTKDR